MESGVVGVDDDGVADIQAVVGVECAMYELADDWEVDGEVLVVGGLQCEDEVVVLLGNDCELFVSGGVAAVEGAGREGGDVEEEVEDGVVDLLPAEGAAHYI